MCLALGIRIHVYLDNWLIRGSTREEVVAHTLVVLQLVERLGWLVNKSKSDPDPTQVCIFVGHQFDLSQALVRPTPERWSKLLSLILQLRMCTVRTERKLMFLLGLLSS